MALPRWVKNTALTVLLCLGAAQLEAVTITGRITACDGKVVPGRLLVGVTEEIHQGTIVQGVCRILPGDPPVVIQVAGASIEPDGTYQIEFEPVFPDPMPCRVLIAVYIEVFRRDEQPPHQLIKLATSPKKPLADQVVFDDLEVPFSNCPPPVINAFSFDAPTIVSGPPASTKTFDAFVLLTTEDVGDTGLTGPDGWNINVSAVGGTVTSATIAGTVAAQAADGPPGLNQPCGLNIVKVDSTGPFSTEECEDLVIATVGTQMAESCPFRPLRLPLGTSYRILRVTISVTIPPTGGICRLYFPNGCQIFANPIDNQCFYFNVDDGTFFKFPAKRVDFLVTLQAQGAGQQSFRRSDVNSDGGTDLGDAIASVFALFVDPSVLRCEKAGDSNDDARHDLSDVGYLLNYLYLNGEPPGAPSSGCGDDPTPDELTCGEFTGC